LGPIFSLKVSKTCFEAPSASFAAAYAGMASSTCALSTTLKSKNTEADGIEHKKMRMDCMYVQCIIIIIILIINTMISIDVQRLEP
jgi:hypothetical protein